MIRPLTCSKQQTFHSPNTDQVNITSSTTFFAGSIQDEENRLGLYASKHLVHQTCLYYVPRNSNKAYTCAIYQYSPNIYYVFKSWGKAASWTRGTTSSSVFSSLEEALEEYHKTVTSKKNKGYVVYRVVWDTAYSEELPFVLVKYTPHDVKDMIEGLPATWDVL